MIITKIRKAIWASWILFMLSLPLSPFERKSRDYVKFFAAVVFCQFLFKLGRLIRFGSKIGSYRNKLGFQVGYFADQLCVDIFAKPYAFLKQ